MIAYLDCQKTAVFEYKIQAVSSNLFHYAYPIDGVLERSYVSPFQNTLPVLYLLSGGDTLLLFAMAQWFGARIFNGTVSILSHRSTPHFTWLLLLDIPISKLWETIKFSHYVYLQVNVSKSFKSYTDMCHATLYIDYSLYGLAT